MADDQRPMNRRRFFREGLAELLKPLQHRMAPLARVAEEVGKLDQPIAPKQSPAPQSAPWQPPTQSPPGTAARGSSSPYDPANGMDTWLRPPGVTSEEHLANTCSKCGHCEEVCPVKAIKIDWGGGQGEGLPYIEADTQPCVMCDGLHCMRQCPSGALQEVARNDIKMGTAEWQPNTCIRAAGDPCTTCIDQCPVGNAAIELKNNRIHVIEAGCTGCGVCQHHCPSVPKSIVVVPRTEERVIVPAD